MRDSLFTPRIKREKGRGRECTWQLFNLTDHCAMVYSYVDNSMIVSLHSRYSIPREYTERKRKREPERGRKSDG